MKVSVKRTGTIFTILFVVGILVTAWMLYQLPENLVYRATVIDLKELEVIQPILNELNIVVASVFMLGLLAIITFLLNHRTADIQNETLPEQQKESQEQPEKVENEEEVEEIFQGADLDQINLMLAEKEDNKQKLNNVLNKICNHIEAVQGALYVVTKEKNIKYIELMAAYAYHKPESEEIRYEFGEGLAGQVAKEGKLVNINEVPEGYIKVISGLGDTTPNNLLIVPLKKGNTVIGVVEIASFKAFRKGDIAYLEQVFSLAAEKTMVKSAENKNKTTKKTATTDEAENQTK
ncbi:MAG: GAF domain-containing protein [Cytophagales bacterium]|nr:GAF domain-containing protein [Cytophagales bacterium]